MYLVILSPTTMSPALISPSKKILFLAQKVVPSLEELTINMSCCIKKQIYHPIAHQIESFKFCHSKQPKASKTTKQIEIKFRIGLSHKTNKRLCIYAYFVFYNCKQNQAMSHLLHKMMCPKQQKAGLVCINSNCNCPPFHCQDITCGCATLHFKCQIMQVGAVSEYLQNWKSYVSVEGKQFMSRVHKIFSNIRSRLQREEKIFATFCSDLFIGKDYSKLMHFIERDDKKQITSQLIASSIKNITDKGSIHKFAAFTLSEMQLIDQNISQLTVQIENMYKSKQVKQLEEKIKRCSSVVLQRQSKNSSTNSKQPNIFSEVEQNICSLKLDLTFPRNICSKIITEATTINRLLAKKIHKFHLAYRASEHLFSVTDFYKKVTVTSRQLKEIHIKQKQNYQLASLIILKTEFGKLLGGYTPLQWEATKRSVDSDEEENPQKSSQQGQKYKLRCDSSASTVLFSLDLMEKYCLNKPEQAIYCGSKSIGFGRGDLKIVDKADQVRKSSCKFPLSYNFNVRPYVSWSKSGMELSGARLSMYFKILEWQAFIIEF